MADLYEVYAYSPEGVREAALQGWEYLEFTQRISAPWNHNLRWELSDRDAPGENTVRFLRDNLDVDWILVVYRTDPITHVRTRVYEGFNRTIVDQAKSSGAIIVNLYGSGYTELLSRRVVVPPSGYEASTKTGVAETIMKAFVSEQAISPADPDRIIPGLSNEADSFNGHIVTHSARYTNLATVLSRIAQDGEVEFGVVGGPSVGSFEFQVRTTWGEDKTRQNPSGREPVIFDMGAGTMSIPIYSRNRSDEKTYLYVGGYGEGINQFIFPFGSITETDSIYNRREAFVDSRDAFVREAAIGTAYDYFAKNKAKETLTFNVIQTGSLRWLTHWGLGDLVSSRYYNRILDQKITEVTVRVGSGGGQGQREYVAPEIESLPHSWLLGIDGRTELEETTILG